MKWTIIFGALLLISSGLCGCVGYNGACGPYGMNGYGSYPGMMNRCSPCGTYDACDPCNTCGPNYAYTGGALQNVGCGALQVAATPGSWLLQVLRGSYYPCGGGGCGDEIYWGDYGHVPNDYCDPCTYEGHWAGSTAASGNCGDCGECMVCQRGTFYRYPTVGHYTNQALAPIFQDKISATHAKTPMDYGLRAPSYDTCFDSCGTSSCGYETYSGGCTDGCCGVSNDGYTGQVVQQPAKFTTPDVNRYAKPTYTPVRHQNYRR